MEQTERRFDLVVEVAAGANRELDEAVLNERGTVSVYANEGSVPLTLDIGRSLHLNTRYQFILLYTLGPEQISQGARNITHAIQDGAFQFGEARGLPIHPVSALRNSGGPCSS